MIEKFTNDNRLKITILRLRDTSHYDGTNGKHILDSFFHVLDKFIEKYKEKFDFNTYNFNIKSLWSPKNKVRDVSKYKHIIKYYCEYICKYIIIFFSYLSIPFS